MKIGVLTHQLHTNIGGILQAYALQYTLKKRGYEVVLININKNNIFILLLKIMVRAFRKYSLLKKDIVVLSEYQQKIKEKHTQRFVNKYINRSFVADFSSLKKEKFDAFIVGSDQIWRPSMLEYNIKEAFFYFAKEWKVKRIAYAASFGLDKWQFTSEETLTCSELAKKFDLITVREDSGVGLCAENLGVQAHHVLDPTMLLYKEDYVSLIKDMKTKVSEGDLLVYILNTQLNNDSFINKLADITHLCPFSVNANVSDQTLSLNERIQIPVEQWLRGFSEAKFVLTDSFHACVFSIIFNVPFAVIVNEKGGLTRIQSLLKMYHLEFCLISDLSQISTLPVIDWEKVNAIREERKNDSLSLLFNALDIH